VAQQIVLAIDVGTTNLKVATINESGEIIRKYTQNMRLFQDASGKAEQSPEELLKSITEGVRYVSMGYEDSISLIAICANGLSLVPVDDNFNPLTGIMTIVDSRPREVYNDFLKDFDARSIYTNTFVTPSIHTPLLKLYWLKKKADFFQKAKYYLSCKDFIIAQIFGQPLTDPNTASTNGYFNVKSLTWEESVLSALGLAVKNFPRIVGPNEVIGRLPKKWCDIFGLKSAPLVLSGLFDGGAIALGNGIFEGSSLGVINLGTTAMFRVLAESPMIDENDMYALQSYYLCYNKWFVGNALSNAGNAVQWMSEMLSINVPDSDIEALIYDNTLPIFFLPFLTGERAIDFGDIASGFVVGLRPTHTKIQLMRSTFEGVGFMFKMILETLQRHNLKPLTVRIGGGGSRSKTWLRIISSILNTPLIVADKQDSSLLGLAILGFTTLGMYHSLMEASENMINNYEEILPDKFLVEKYSKEYEFFKTLLGISKGIFEQYHELFEK